MNTRGSLVVRELSIPIFSMSTSKISQRTMTIDLAQTANVPENVFDCIICTQTLFLIPDYNSAVRSL